jgi:hypothetical protein
MTPTHMRPVESWPIRSYTCGGILVSREAIHAFLRHLGKLWSLVPDQELQHWGKFFQTKAAKLTAGKMVARWLVEGTAAVASGAGILKSMEHGQAVSNELGKVELEQNRRSADLHVASYVAKRDRKSFADVVASFERQDALAGRLTVTPRRPAPATLRPIAPAPRAVADPQAATKEFQRLVEELVRSGSVRRLGQGVTQAERLRAGAVLQVMEDRHELYLGMLGEANAAQVSPADRWRSKSQPRPTTTTTTTAANTAKAKFDARVSELMSRGWDRLRSINWIAQHEPQLHTALIAEANRR